METLTKVGKYDVVDVLGRGGMGVVYKAMDPGIGRLVAIKMMTVGFTENPDLLRRFYREAQSTGTLQHPNIVIVYELGDQDGNPYLVMEYLEGESLDKIISARRQLTLVQRLDILIQLCDALNYAHSRGVVHRDIKPANIVVLSGGGVKIVDFGIARIGGDALTRTGQIVGTINYMSPEQVGAQVVDGRSDIFSAGVVAYQLLTFALPFEGNDTASTLLKIINEAPPPLSAYTADCPPELEEAVLRAVAKDRDERYQTAEDFALDLMHVREHLRREQVENYIEQAQAAAVNAEHSKAKELLLEVLKVDSRNLVAKQRLQQVQQLLQKQQRSEQVKQLREMATSAISQRQFAEALNYLDQALALDKSNAELQQQRETVQQEKQRQQQIEDALRKAESAQQTDDLETAESAVNEALRLDANSTRARALHATVARQLAERARQSKLQSLLSSAAKEISGRHFTGAIDLLKQAESLDPSAPELHALLKLAVSGREQETRRRELEAFTTAVEEALSHDDYAGACDTADEALLKFPGDPGLMKLRTLAEKQKQTGEKKKFAEEQLAAARALIEAGKSAESLQVLESAAKRAPADSRLNSMLAVLRDNIEREAVEKRKQQFIRTAKDALRAKRYDEAVAALEAGFAEFPDAAEITDLLQFARDEAEHAACRKHLDEIADDAQRLLAAEDFEQAIALLEGALHENPDEELRLIASDARRRLDDFNKRLETAITRSQQLLDRRKPEEAVALLESQPKSFSRSPAFCEVLARAHEEREHWQQWQKALHESHEAQAKNDFAAAIAILQKCRAAVGEEFPELAKALSDVEAKRTASAKTGVERAMRDGRMLLLARQYNAGLQALEPVVPLTSFVAPELKAEFDKLVDEISQGATAQAMKLAKATGSETQVTAADQTGVSESFDTTGVGAQTPVPRPAPRAPAAQRTVIATAPQSGTAAATARAPSAAAAVSPAAIAIGAATSKPRSTGMIIAAIAIALLIVAAGAYFALRRSGPPVAECYISINAVPWGTVKTVTTADGKNSIAVNQVTPTRISVPAGEYTVIIAGPNGTERSQQVKASRESPAAFTVVFEAIDVEQIINSH